nr:hypothetical protein [Tanacetum cinerariifolium]
PIPPVIQFGSNFHVGESSAMKDLLARNSEVYAPGPMFCVLKNVHKGVKRLGKQMHDRYRMEKKMEKKLRQDELRMNGQEFDIKVLDSAVRENRFENSNMLRLIMDLSMEFIELKNQNRRAEIIIENVPPPNNIPNAPEEEPILDQAPVALVRFAPQWIGGQIPDNNNGWLEEDPEEELEEEDEDMVNDEVDDAEVINPYEEANPHNRPPPISNKETEFAPHVNRRAEVLSRWEAWVRGRIPNNLRFQEEPSIYTALVPRADDRYVMVRDAAMDTRGHEDVYTDAPRDTQPSEPRGSLCDLQIRPPKRRSQTNPQPTLTQEDIDQLVRNGIKAAIRDE